ncbi:Methionyl-tRNA formyltransferase [Streptomyces californicus]
MKLVFAGTPEVAVPALDALIASDRHEVAAVVTRPDAPAGRGRRLVASPVAERAEEAGIEVLKPARPRDEAFLARLREIAPDCCPVVAYGALLPKVALDVPARGWVNLHFSLLPAWRGAAPVQHAVMAGDEVTGASTFLIEEGLDSGPVYGVLTEEVRPTDTSGDLLTRLAFAGAGLLAATMDGIEDGTLHAVPQPPEGVTLAPKITVEDAQVDWSAPALRVDRVVRGCTPAPGAWTLFRGERLKLVQAVPVPDRTDLVPGELSAAKNNVYAGTGSHAVELLWVQPQGKKPMRAADVGRAVGIAPGELAGGEGSPPPPPLTTEDADRWARPATCEAAGSGDRPRWGVRRRASAPGSASTFHVNGQRASPSRSSPRPPAKKPYPVLLPRASRRCGPSTSRDGLRRPGVAPASCCRRSAAPGATSTAGRGAGSNSARQGRRRGLAGHHRAVRGGRRRRLRGRIGGLRGGGPGGGGAGPACPGGRGDGRGPLGVRPLNQGQMNGARQGRSRIAGSDRMNGVSGV